METSTPADILARSTVILLAGGQSQRMGRDKALLPYGGRAQWQRLRELCLAAGCTRVLVSGNPATIPGAIADREPGTGPLGGIAAVIAALDAGRAPAGNDDDADAGWLLAIPVDLPLLNADALHELARAGGDAPAACFAGHPLPALLRDTRALRAALAATRAADSPRQRSLYALHRALAAREIALPPALAAALTNTNTPAEWLAAGGDALP